MSPRSSVYRGRSGQWAFVGHRVSLGQTGFRVPITVVLNKRTLRYHVAIVYAAAAIAMKL